jgi:hypothetical protein
MEGAMQQAPQPGRQFMVYAIDSGAAHAISARAGGQIDDYFAILNSPTA